MLFNSLEFFIFWAVVYTLYLLLPHRWQNRMLWLASYVFYGFWDWRFISLIVISTVVDYCCGLAIDATDRRDRKKKYLWVSIGTNLALLGFFKYYNFFIGSLTALLDRWGLTVHPMVLTITLPVGISFYTFQTLSYTIDIYHGEIKPTRSFPDFALFVAFFPQLVAGPIERAKHLLPQILGKRTVTLRGFYEGSFLIFWGLFEKIFVADNLAKIAGPVFGRSSAEQGGGLVLIGLYAFAFQIFCDFDGYSNIARGLGKCMGFDIMVNFRLPYFAANPREFWQRWHISLSSWLRDYLYIPLGGNRRGARKTYRNLALTMLLGGLWHGAAWHFVAWGAYQGLLLILYRVGGELKQRFFRTAGAKRARPLKVFLFFHLTVLGWLLFRAPSLGQAGGMLGRLIFHFSWGPDEMLLALKTLGFVWPLLAVQAAQVKSNDLMFLFQRHWLVKTAVYALMTYLVLGWGVMKPEEFIYFQF